MLAILIDVGMCEGKCFSVTCECTSWKVTMATNHKGHRPACLWLAGHHVLVVFIIHGNLSNPTLNGA